ncbi:Uncharacterized aarF domain-containing protein kinase At1g71810 [Durusdinium trenchii]|uniref:Chloroplastic n=1 Tax=Durusdinium trenchii TaxID=1381693 RepID=A0ABP0S864_9DINO
MMAMLSLESKRGFSRRAISLGRFQTNDSLASEEAEGPNLEDAFAAFTPRLRAIREEQLLEYRINNPRPSSAERESFVSTAYILRHLAGWVQRFFQLNTDLPALVDEYGARLVDELDFTREAERSVAFSRFASKLSLGSVTTARPVPELTTSSVLVTEWVQGERLELTAARDLEEAQRLQAVAMTCYLAMLLELGSLHAVFGSLFLAAPISTVVLLTGANAIVHEVIARSFWQALDGEAQVFHLAPRNYKCPFDFGKVLEAGADNLERRKILAQSAQVGISVEGGPGTAEEIAHARAAGIAVLPVARTGGASSTAHASGPKPAHVEDAQWKLLADSSAPLEETANAVVEMVASML